MWHGARCGLAQAEQARSLASGGVTRRARAEQWVDIDVRLHEAALRARSYRAGAGQDGSRSACRTRSAHRVAYTLDAAYTVCTSGGCGSQVRECGSERTQGVPGCMVGLVELGVGGRDVVRRSVRNAPTHSPRASRARTRLLSDHCRPPAHLCVVCSVCAQVRHTPREAVGRGGARDHHAALDQDGHHPRALPARARGRRLAPAPVQAHAERPCGCAECCRCRRVRASVSAVPC